MSANIQRQLAQYLANARFEVLPLHGVLAETGQLPPGTTVTVTASPARGPEATLDVAAGLAERGFHVVPHLAARSIVDGAQLSDLLDRMAGMGLSEAFVVAGDSPVPAGEFTDALALLRAMDELGRRPRRIGITGYPERHALISDSSTMRAMAEKAGHADYVVSQICYDPNTIASWVKSLRSRGITLPVHIGVPGAVDVTRLLRISLKIGLGESLRFLRKQHGGLTRLLSRYTPEDLFDELAPCLVDPAYGIAGWHFFTFNEVARTERFRREMTARIEEVSA